MGKTNVKNIAPHPAQKGIDKNSQVKRATKTTVNNDIEVLKESKRHTFQDWSCDIRSSAKGWTKHVVISIEEPGE